MKKIVFFGSKKIGFECLQILYNLQKKTDFSIIGVLTNKRGDDIRNFCAVHQLSIIESLDDYLLLNDVDIAISVQYHLILKKVHITKAKEITVNLHMAPLPEYRGCNQFSFAILNNDKIFGTTFHRLEEGVDSGAIMFEKRFQIPDNCWVENLHELTFKKTIELFEEHIIAIINGNYDLLPQDTYIGVRTCSIHYRNEIEKIKEIDLTWDKEKIERHIRASYMPGFEPPYTFIGATKLYFNKNYDK
jgi:methionyl-tRNA formyltransferase